MFMNLGFLIRKSIKIKSPGLQVLHQIPLQMTLHTVDSHHCKPFLSLLLKRETERERKTDFNSRVLGTNIFL